MKLRLVSDYMDFYDMFFDEQVIHPSRYKGPEEVCIDMWREAGNSRETCGPARPEQFKIMAERLDETIVPHGMVPEMLERYPGQDLVVYTVDWLHAARGKYHCTAAEAAEHHSDKFASLFIKTQANNEPALSYKYVQLGMHSFWLAVTNPVDWRTNVLGAEVDLRMHAPAEGPYLPYKAVYAIDYIVDRETGIQYACDLNHAPGLRNLGIRDLVPAKEAVDSIREWYNKFGNLGD